MNVREMTDMYFQKHPSDESQDTAEKFRLPHLIVMVNKFIRIIQTNTTLEHFTFIYLLFHNMFLPVYSPPSSGTNTRT